MRYPFVQVDIFHDYVCQVDIFLVARALIISNLKEHLSAGYQAAQYIGEIARYLLAQPEKAVEKQHQVSIAYGNGLRPQIWRQFQQRFHIERIGEFYGATEGNANMSKW